MVNAKLHKSKMKAVIHQTARELHSAGLVNQISMRRFDASCLTHIPDLAASEIRALRKREAASQAAFARCLNVSVEMVSHWERGLKKPSGPALKLLSLVLKRGLTAIA